MRSVGIFAGTFDPIHVGHIAVCLDAKQKFGLGQVQLMVEPQPWRKADVTPYDLRYEMCLLATQAYPDIILEYSQEERFSVASTLPALMGKYEGMNVYYIVGADEFAYLPQWQDISSFVAAVGFIVALRAGQDEGSVQQTLKKLHEVTGISPRCEVFESTLPAVSSTVVKQDLRESGHSDFLDPQVQAYIKSHKLYAPGPVG